MRRGCILIRRRQQYHERCEKVLLSQSLKWLSLRFEAGLRLIFPTGGLVKPIPEEEC